MRPTVLALLPALAMGACTPLPEAPEDFTEIGGFLYQYFTEAESPLADGVANMRVWLEGNLDAKKGTEETIRDGYTVRDLPLSVLASVRPDVDEESEDQIAGSSVATDSSYDVDTIALTLSLEEQEDVFPTNFVSHDREFLAGRDCFAEKSCTFLDTQNLVEASYGNAPFDLEINTNSRSQYRWVPLGNDEWAMLNRTWLQAEPEIGGGVGPLLTLHEQIYLGVVMPYEGGTVTVGTTWVSASIVDLNENFALRQMVNAMRDNGAALDKYLASQ